MNKQEIATKIWSGANALRGKVSAAKYKDYMLSFIFYKYLCNAEVNYAYSKYYTDEDIKDLKENTKNAEQMRNNLGYFISYDNLFSTWLSKGSDFQISDVREALSAFGRNVSKTHEKLFNNIFSVLDTGLNDLGSDEGARTKALRQLFGIIADIPTEGKEDYDVLGFIYEFLLKNFAANAGKAGEFYTPYEASEIMSEIIANHLQGRETISIYDPTSGSGSLLLNIGKSVSKRMGDQNKIKYYAQELIPETFNLTRMNLIMRNVSPSNIVARCGDSLADDWPFFKDSDDQAEREKTYQLIQVDSVCSNPPYSQSWSPKEGPRFDGYGLAPKGKADYAFLLHSLYHLKPDGIMTIVLPHGVLFRGGDEGVIRKNLLNKHNIETIIGLPANCFYGTGIPVIIMVLKKTRTEDDVLFVDASKCYEKEGTKNKLRAKDIKKIVDTVIARDTIPNFSRLVSYSEIEGNDFNLNIPRYVDSSEKEYGYDLYGSMNSKIPNKELNSLEKYWDSFPSLKAELFESVENNYSLVKNQNVNDIIQNNRDVVSSKQNFTNTIKQLSEFLHDELITNMNSVQIVNEETKIANKIKELLQDNNLVDYYDAYEELNNAWKTISFDFTAIQEEGFGSIRQIETISQWKKTKNNNELIQETIGEEGKIFPFSLIQEKYFSSLKEEIKTLENEIAELKSEKTDLLNSIDPNDKAELLKDDDSEEINSKKLKAKISDLKNQIKKGAEFEDDGYESTVLKIGENTTKISDLGKELKAKKKQIEEETREKIETISDNEAMELLTDKWITPLCNNINSLLDSSLKNLATKVKNIEAKYDTTLDYLDDELSNTEDELIKMLNQLTGDEDNLKGINLLKASLERGE